METYVIALCATTVVSILQTMALAILLIVSNRKAKTKTYTFKVKDKTIDHRLTKSEAATISEFINQYKFETGEDLFSFSEKIL